MGLAASLVDGLISGAALATVALAFSVVYLPTRIFHVALGAIFAATPFVFSQFREWGLPAFAAGLLTIAAAIATSVLVERWNHAPLDRRRATDATHFITSLGLFIVFVQLVVIVWDEQGRFLRRGADSLLSFPLLEIQIGRTRALLGLGSAAVVGGFLVLLYATPIGLRLRAVAQNPDESALRGLNIDRLRQQAFAISGALAGAGALLFAVDRGYDAYLGFDMVLLAVVAVIIGGRESFVGPIIGALLLGLARELVRFYLSARWLDALSFAVLVVFLLVRPLGLIGRQTRVEEELP